MAISSVSTDAARYIPQQPNNTQQIKAGKDADGDQDGTKIGQIEKAGESAKAAEKTSAATLTSSTLGSNINTTA